MNFGRINYSGDSGVARQGAAFGPLAAALPAISLATGLAGTIVSGAGAIAQGNAQKAAADYQAQQQRQEAAEALAASQRKADDQKKQTELVMSRQQAGAAASGLGALDPTILQLAGDTFAQGKLNSDMYLYQGQSQRNGLLNQAAATEASGRIAQQGATIGALGTIAGGASGFYSKYAMLDRPEPLTAPKKLYDDDSANYNYGFGG